MNASRSAAQGAFLRVEALFNRLLGDKLNPLYHLGAIAYYQFWIALATGFYLYVFFETSVTSAYASVESINDAIREAANGPLKGILGYSDEELVSIDFNHNPLSSIVDTSYTRSVGPRCHKVLSWYDNEWGYSNRVLDLVAYVAKKKSESLARK